MKRVGFYIFCFNFIPFPFHLFQQTKLSKDEGSCTVSDETFIDGRLIVQYTVVLYLRHATHSSFLIIFSILLPICQSTYDEFSSLVLSHRLLSPEGFLDSCLYELYKLKKKVIYFPHFSIFFNFCRIYYRLLNELYQL